MTATAATRVRERQVVPVARAVQAAAVRRAVEPSRFERRIDRDTDPAVQRSSPPAVGRISSLSHLRPQRATPISSPTDPAEREAESTARQVMNMAPPARARTASSSTAVARRHGGARGVAVGPMFHRASVAHSVHRAGRPHVAQRAPGSEVARASIVQRDAAEATNAEAEVIQKIEASTVGGMMLPQDVRDFMEPRFEADFSGVRVHTDEIAAGLSARISARAFAYRNHIFFGRGQYQPNTPDGAELLAHELTHTIQQQAVVQRAEVAREIAAPTHTVVVEQRQPSLLQRLGLSDILDGLADLAANVPGFTLLTLIIGRNPINLRVVEFSTINLLRAFMGIIPGGDTFFQVLNRNGVAQRIATWVDEQMKAMGLTFQSIADAFARFTDSLGFSDLFSPGDVWRRAQNVFTPTLTRIRNFVAPLIAQAITWLKETFMQPLASFCGEIPGYGIVKVMLGHDPFTNAPAPRTPMNVVRAFAEFIPGGTEKVDQLVQSRSLERAYQWFIDETQSRNLTWERVTGTFAEAWAALRLEDVLTPVDTLRRMLGIFRPLLSDLLSFARAALMKLAELIFEAAMGAGGARIVAIFKRARDTFNVIIADPVRFLRHCLNAIRQGVTQFMNNILTHLRNGVIAWLTGPVARAGIQVPEQWDLRGIIWFVMQILGLTWPNIRLKLVRLMGERPVAMLEGAFQLIQDIRERGLVQALRDRVNEFFGNLREAALGAIKGFIQQRLVMAGIQQLISLLSPVGAVIQAIIKTYNTIKFFIDKINEILDFVESVVNSIADMAAGRIGPAANRVEQTLARTIPIILDFLARFIGLGNVGEQVQTTIRTIQARVDQMLDRAVDWIRRQAASLASRALGGDPNAPPQQRLDNAINEAETVVNRYAGRSVGALVLRPLLAAIRVRHRLIRLDVVPDGEVWKIEGEVNPRRGQRSRARVGAATIPTNVRYTPGGSTAKSTEVYAMPLTHLAGNTRGSEPPRVPSFPRAWATFRNEGALWKRVHLLSRHLHGPGNEEANIVPGLELLNSGMRDGPEAWAKRELIDDTSKVGWYRVTVNYGHPAPFTEFASSISVRAGFCTGTDSATPRAGPAVSAANLNRNNLGVPNAAPSSGPLSIASSAYRTLFAAFRADDMTEYLAQWLAGQSYSSPNAVLAAMRTSTDTRISGKESVVRSLMSGPSPRLVP